MLIKSLSSIFKKILDKIVKNKDLNLKIREGVKKFFRYNIKWIFNNIKLNILYFFLNKKKLSDLIFFQKNNSKGSNHLDLYKVLGDLVEKKKIRKILEIGIGGHSMEYTGGQSLQVLSFFFNRAKVFGIDISSKVFLDNNKIKTYICDESDSKKLNDISSKIGELDIIIDDGSHIPRNQKNNFLIFFNKLKDKGIYIIEDIGSSYEKAFDGDPELIEEGNLVSFFKDYIHCVNSEMLIEKNQKKFGSFIDIEKIFFFKNSILIQKRIRNEKPWPNEYAYENLDAKNKRWEQNKLRSGLRIYK